VRDLVVAGGGPAGLATALHAVRAGLDVEVWEPRAGVVDKACGEGLMPGGLAALRGLGVDPPGHELAGIRYLADGMQATADFTRGPGRGVRRTALHAAMRSAALEAGVPIVQRAVGTVDQRDGHVLADDVAAGHLVAADGLHSPVRRQLGLDAPAGRRRRYGLRAHLSVTPWTSHVEVHWTAGAEAYVTPVADDRVGVAVLTSRREPFEVQVRRFPGLVGRLAGATGPVRGAGPLRQRARRRVVGRVLLVGDAGGYVDALTGEGISLALAQAEAAVAAIVAGEPGDYEREWQRLTWRYRALTAGLLGATRLEPVRRRLVPAAARLPGVFGAAVNVLARPV
jgi:flavin-dependent dehydrogenase